MNRERAKELSPIIQAYANGEDVQVLMDGKWININEPVFYDCSEYRIKHRPFECWVNVYDTTLQGICHKTKEIALRERGPDAIRTIKMREVEED